MNRVMVLALNRREAEQFAFQYGLRPGSWLYVANDMTLRGWFGPVIKVPGWTSRPDVDQIAEVLRFTERS